MFLSSGTVSQKGWFYLLSCKWPHSSKDQVVSVSDRILEELVFPPWLYGDDYPMESTMLVKCDSSQRQGETTLRAGRHSLSLLFIGTKPLYVFQMVHITFVYHELGQDVSFLEASNTSSRCSFRWLRCWSGWSYKNPLTNSSSVTPEAWNDITTASLFPISLQILCLDGWVEMHRMSCGICWLDILV